MYQCHFRSYWIDPCKFKCGCDMKIVRIEAKSEISLQIC